MQVRWNILGKTWRTICHSTLRCLQHHHQKKINSHQQDTMKEKQKGENSQSSKKGGFDQGALVGGGKGDDRDIKCTNLERQIDT